MRQPYPRRRFLKILAAEVALASLAPKALLGQAPTGQALARHDWRGIALGADASLQLHLADSQKAPALIQKCVAELQRLERIFSLYDSRSELAQLNATGAMEGPSPELRTLIERAIELREMTNGAFDISIHPVVELYRASFARRQAPPTSEELEEARRLVALDQVEVTPQRIALRQAGMKLTLNGIAQGFITDRITDLLEQEGVEHSLVDCGEKRCLGQHPDKRPWSLGIRDGSNTRELFTVAELENQALSTSGGYGTTFDAEGRYHHLVNASDGTCASRYRSVSVIAPEATLADALSTAIATGPSELAPIIKQRFPATRLILQPATA